MLCQATYTNLTPEMEHTINCFCSLIVLQQNKKMSYANVFLLILKDKKIRDLYKKIIDEEDDFLALKWFLAIEPNICKSKFISKYLNSQKKFVL